MLPKNEYKEDRIVLHLWKKAALLCLAVVGCIAAEVFVIWTLATGDIDDIIDDIEAFITAVILPAGVVATLCLLPRRLIVDKDGIRFCRLCRKADCFITWNEILEYHPELPSLGKGGEMRVVITPKEGTPVKTPFFDKAEYARFTARFTALHERYAPASLPLSDYHEREDDSRIIRRIGDGERAKVLLSARVDGYEICYRRYRGKYELAVRDAVYAERKVDFKPHTLCAVISGNVIQAGMRQDEYCYIRYNGKIILTKYRIF